MADKKEKRRPEMRAISAMVPVEILEKARLKSSETGVAVSFIVRQALERWVEEPEKTKRK